MASHPRHPSAETRAIELRKKLTPSELVIWKAVRRRKLGHHFRRQEPIGPYIADFVCYHKMLIVEADGSQHEDSDYDARRGAYLRGLGFRVLRFKNAVIAQESEWVFGEIRRALEQTPS
ncbi:MAG: endonuclease domain-containing protein [Actinomycetota bacterium]|nr:endonuclease domain-containing protein [Actinomycetota bacterium]